MLFNSTEFLFAFLPAALVIFYVLGAISRVAAIRWLILASLAFYAWWRPVNVLIIAPSMAINFAFASILLRLSRREGSRLASKAILGLGIAFNAAFLGVFKYLDFLFGTINDIFGANLVLQNIIPTAGHIVYYLSKDRVSGRCASGTGEIVYVARLLYIRAVFPTARRWSDCPLSRNDAAVPHNHLPL